MAESGGLENRWTFTRPVGSNPTPSANYICYIDMLALLSHVICTIYSSTYRNIISCSNLF